MIIKAGLYILIVTAMRHAFIYDVYYNFAQCIMCRGSTEAWTYASVQFWFKAVHSEEQCVILQEVTLLPVTVLEVLVRDEFSVTPTCA